MKPLKIVSCTNLAYQMKSSCCLWIQCCKFPGSGKIGFRDRIKMNSSRSTQALRSKASSPVPPGSVRQSPSNENMSEATSPTKVQKSWSFNDRTRFRTSLRLKARPSADGIARLSYRPVHILPHTKALNQKHVGFTHDILLSYSGGSWGREHRGQVILWCCCRGCHTSSEDPDSSS